MSHNNNTTHTLTIRPVARLNCDFPTKFGLPRQSGIIKDLQGTIVFEPEFRNPDALRGLEEYTYIWLIWEFSENIREDWAATVRPPRLGGNARKGVFATRSPFRPNPIGMSCVKLEAIEYDSASGPVIHVSGADLMNGTPIFDIKPYMPSSDSFPEASRGFAGNIEDYQLTVSVSDELLSLIPADKQSPLIQALSEDPRPSYQKDPQRIYGFKYAGFEVKFTVEGSGLTVVSIEPEG